MAPLIFVFTFYGNNTEKIFTLKVVCLVAKMWDTVHSDGKGMASTEWVFKFQLCDRGYGAWSQFLLQLFYSMCLGMCFNLPRHLKSTFL